MRIALKLDPSRQIVGALRVLRLLLAGVFAAWLPAHAQDDKRSAALREEVLSVPVAAAGATIVVTSFRPKGKGPFPWIVHNHGTPGTVEEIRSIGRNRNLGLAREWVKRGYAFIVPVRRGYGASGGRTTGDSYGSCRNPDYRRAGESAALDLLAVVEWAKAQPDLDPDRWLFAGQSAGGFASIYAASKQPAGLVAVLAFAPGRGGRPDTHPGETCEPDRMADLFAEITPRIAVPVLWFYAENDQYIGPRIQKLWFERFRAAGGRGEYVMIPPFPESRGHGVFSSPKGVPLWTPAVAAFYRKQGIALPF